MESHCVGKWPPFDLHILEEHRVNAALRKRVDRPTIPNPKDHNSHRKKEKGRHFFEELASGICGFDDSSDSS